MNKGRHRLTLPQIKAARTPGLVPDGGGLYLQVTAGKDETVRRKSWLLRYLAPNGKRREMGLGPIDDVPLADARDLADNARKLAKSGVDPIEDRDARREAAALEAARSLTFKQAAEHYIDAHKAGWQNAKHAAQWSATLEAYAFPHFGALPVAAVDVGLVLKAVEPIWRTKTETASRVRGRIEAVLDWAAVRGYRSGENPARWRGHLQKALPSRSSVRAVKHHAALPFPQLGAFMADLRKVEGLGALALEFTILTACRSNEALGARWREFDLDKGLWTIPAERMKAKREHRVPLSRQALAILTRAKALASRDFVFPHSKREVKGKKPLSSMAMAMALRRMKRGDLTVHGMRSCFRDWAGDATRFPREVIEAALAHGIPDKAEAAYRRSDALEKRRALMQAWADYADRVGEKSGARVVNIRGKETAT